MQVTFDIRISTFGFLSLSLSFHRGTTPMDCLALDIGGANLKVADGLGYTATRRFPLWQTPGELGEALRECLAEAPLAKVLAVTMTGELADCYQTKAQGVTQILAAVRSISAGRPTYVYRTDGRFQSPDVATRQPLSVAAANWHALAQFACRYLDGGSGLLVDIGSTTTDIVPLLRGSPTARGSTDPERLLCGELVYTGVVRSPVCGLIAALPWRDQLCPTAGEVFATACDAYVTLGCLAEDPAADYTADGRGLTRDAARDRLARSICADRTMFDASDALLAARAIRQRQLANLEEAVGRVVASLESQPSTCVISGQGEFLARELVCRIAGSSAQIVSLGEALGPGISGAAPAHALAVLAREAGLT
jgi:hypothetical protein